MTNEIKEFIFKIIRYSGIPFLFREIIQRNKVSILLFHDISEETAIKTFTFLVKRYNIIRLDDFIEAHRKKDFSKIPHKALIITFDDGHIDNYKLLPIIKELQVPITIFLCSAIINTNRMFWFKLQNTSIPILVLKNKSNKERLEWLAKNDYYQTKEYEFTQALQKKHIVDMKDCVNFQSHTLFHPILPQCDNNEAADEIFKSKQILETEYGLNINAIAYPNGDYSERDVQLAKAAGYLCGITVDFGFNTLNSDIFKLKRLSVNDTANMDEFIVKSSGVWSFFKTRNGHKQTFGYAK